MCCRWSSKLLAGTCGAGEWCQLAALFAYAARGWGPSPNTSAMGFAPSNPDSMLVLIERLARMPTGRLVQASK